MSRRASDIVEPNVTWRAAEAGGRRRGIPLKPPTTPRDVEMIRNARAKVGCRSSRPLRSSVARHSAANRSGAVMSVRPGFGRQAFIPRRSKRSRSLRIGRRAGIETIIEVDGGISSHNAHEAPERAPTRGRQCSGPRTAGRDREDAQRLTCRPVSSVAAADC